MTSKNTAKIEELCDRIMRSYKYSSYVNPYTERLEEIAIRIRLDTHLMAMVGIPEERALKDELVIRLTNCFRKKLADLINKETFNL